MTHKRSFTTTIEGVQATVEGLFIYGELSAGEESIDAFLHDFNARVAVFDSCIGSYRVRIDYPDGKKIYFADSAGVMYWFVDYLRGQVVTALSDIPMEQRVPDMASIAQFLWFGCIYGAETILDGVSRSDPEYYYVLQNGTVTPQSKNLTPFEQLPAKEDALEQYICRILKATQGKETIGCCITAGTDSRAVLAHLKARGVRPLLSITGRASDPDVQAAGEIAKILGDELLVIPDMPTESSWIPAVTAETDGQTGICGAYRLVKQFHALEDRGISLQFGGGAGEFYKNSFINQDYPQYKGAPNWSKFLKLKVITYNFPEEICGSALLPEIQKVPRNLLHFVSEHSGTAKASAYLKAGYRILQARGATLSMMENRHVTTCNPLLERCIVAPMFHTNPYALEMQAYQREQVSRFCPAIMDVPTDRGLTLNSAKIRKEKLKSTIFLLKIALNRLFHRHKVTGRIDSGFQMGLSSEAYRVALEQCKHLGILNENLSPESIPMSIADRIFTVGCFFGKN